MKSQWKANVAKKFLTDPLALRVYTSQLLGKDPNLVLHGGGNTSVKMQVTDAYGEVEPILYVKGSGWDLATIEKPGFAPVKMDALLKMAEFKKLSDSDMVKLQRAAMLDPYAPNPSVEAILHAIIPYAFVDHTHADAVVTVTNSPNGEQRIKEIYGASVLIIPYVMPGFVLAKKVYEMTKNIDWDKLEGMVLLNHGIFTFHDDAKKSYEKMIELVNKAEKYLQQKKAIVVPKSTTAKENLVELAKIRREVSTVRGSAVLAQQQIGSKQTAFSNLKEIKSIATRGCLTPDHIIRTKRIPVVITDLTKDLNKYISDYKKYFKQYADKSMTLLDVAPRWAVWPQHGTVLFGKTIKELKIIADVTEHTIDAIQSAEKLGGWKTISAKDFFEVEYWELEQAKLKKSGTAPELQGKVALVTGAASGIGKACVKQLHQQGAVVVALDISPKVIELNQTGVMGIKCDITKPKQVEQAIRQTVREFGGIDIVVSNAGIFSKSERIEDSNGKTWQQSLDLNLTSHQQLLKLTTPFLKYGIDPTFIIIGSKNVPAPGPGASAYSVAKAGLTQLARVAALELASDGIRVNVVHPNAVFDTGIWTKDVLNKRAQHYKMSVDEYKKNNLLKVEITSDDVGKLVTTMAGSAFSKTTGSQVTIDGGNERVI